ncbi:MAG: PAS domain-containing sensor histidine kinase [Burkholderiales bacterium]|nr:PAS domain-containing sensor histidine kinase [Burkholderiales bacterium]
MQNELDQVQEITVQESGDRIRINRSGVALLYGVAIIAFLGCSIALTINLLQDRGLGAGGGVAGLLLSILLFYLLRTGRVKEALIGILWGFALIPIFFGFWSFGYSAPGAVCVPVSIMAASWALSVRHAIAMTICAVLAGIGFFVLIQRGVIIPSEPNLFVRMLIFVCMIIVALLLGLIGVRALRLEFAQVRELASSLENKVQDLSRSEASFSTLFVSNPLPSISGDKQGRLIDINHAFLQAFGYTREQLISLSIEDLRIFDDDNDRKIIVKETLRQGVLGMPVRMRLANGERRHFLISSSSFESPNGWRFVALFLDQTDRLKAEQAQHILNVELEQRVAVRTAELSEALASLKRAQSELVQSEKLASLGSMVAGVAHELNTPVGNALMVASTLTDQQQQFEQSLDHGLSRSALNHFLLSVRDTSDILDRNLRRTADLINSFKQVAVDQTSEQRRHFDLRDLAHEVLVTMSPSLRKTTHALICEIPPDIHFDSFPGPLEQVLMNLTNNALRHGFEGRSNGQMRLQAELSSDGWVRLRFSDDGVGISDKNLQKIFDPFFTTKLGQGGSGLGLSIAYNIVTGMLGGKIEVHSELGRGSEFVIDLPLTAPKEAVMEHV